MFNNDALNQLVQLKKDIQASKEYGAGTVVGSNGRFGFVKLEDGRDAFLSPEKMQRVIPGDIVRVSLKKNDKDKLEADLEKLVTPALSRFIGRYRTKGSAHFVEPSGPQSKRWIFLPPKARGKCKEGDYIVAKLVQHPFKEGKPSAKVVERVGRDDEAKFELKYIKAKYQLSQVDSKAANQQASEIAEQFKAEDFGERTDLTHLPFVTIDSASTLDMDDAIALETIERDGEQVYALHIAIADPSNFIKQGSELAKASLASAQTVYLPGGSIPMLPTQLSHHSFSLEAQQKRPALVCHIELNTKGEVLSSSFEFALITSRHKLTYEGVASFISNKAAIEGVSEEIHAMLTQLYTMAQARREFRCQNFIVGQDQTDYDYSFDDNGQITDIRARPRNEAHQIVEEAMLLTNLYGAQLLAEHKLGVCVSHPGFREDRLGEVKALLKEEGIEHGDLNELSEHVKLFQTLAKRDAIPDLAAALKRMMENTKLTTEFSPHLGMGLPVYATLTSPIRRFADLYNHWCLQQILSDKKCIELSPRHLDELSETLQNGKQADRELSQWLLLSYTEKFIGQQAKGKIRIVTQHGFGVKLDDNGIEGFVLLPKDVEKKYDAKRMTLEVNGELLYIGKPVDIKIKGIDKEKRRTAFELVQEVSVTEETESASA